MTQPPVTVAHCKFTVFPAGKPLADAATAVPTVAGLSYVRESFWTDGASVAAAAAGAEIADDAGLEQETLKHAAPATAMTLRMDDGRNQRISAGPSAAT